MKLQHLEQVLKSEHGAYLRQCERIKRFYKFWDKQVKVEQYPDFNCWKIRGKVYIATSINLIAYTIVLTPIKYGKTIEMNFNK